MTSVSVPPRAVEANFDGLPGLTHNYAGLSWGNVASGSNARAASNPREAARQGLAKMRRLLELGYVQGILPPHERPHVPTLRRLGFTGTDRHILEQGWKQAPSLMLSLLSASPMWTANAATVSPSADTADGRVHFTSANLSAMLHRSIEHEVTGRILRATFGDDRHFAHHPALPGTEHFGDEGAANHTRLCGDFVAAGFGGAGVEVFVYGRSVLDRAAPKPQQFPARQTLEASQAVARLHGLDPARTVFVQQNPAMIDAGVFHNDVISVGSGDVLFTYENAFVDHDRVLEDLNTRLGGTLKVVQVPQAAVPVADMVRSYLFNSQLLAHPEGGMRLILPVEAQETDSVRALVAGITGPDQPIREAVFMDLRQSMRNGGGPACLRLRVVLTAAEQAAVNPGSLMTPDRLEALEHWVDRHYRDRLDVDGLQDPALLDEGRTALDELTGLLGLGSVYDFQRE